MLSAVWHFHVKTGKLQTQLCNFGTSQNSSTEKQLILQYTMFFLLLNFFFLWKLNTFSFFLRSSLASYILGLDVDGTSKKNVEGMFFSVFSALLDALLLRAQVIS